MAIPQERQHQNSQTDDLLDRLHQLLTVHRTELGDQEMDHELEWLAEWIEHIRRDDRKASEQLDEHALAMLESIHGKLAQATSEEQRMQLESPLSGATEKHISALNAARIDVSRLATLFVRNHTLNTKTTNRS